MIWYVIAAAAVVVLFAVGGWEDEHTRRAEARREVDRAQPGRAPAAAYAAAAESQGRYAGAPLHDAARACAVLDGAGPAAAARMTLRSVCRSCGHERTRQVQSTADLAEIMLGQGLQ